MRDKTGELFTCHGQLAPPVGTIWHQTAGIQMMEQVFS